MASDDIANLKKKISELESQLGKKDSEIITYRQELMKFSQRLDALLGQMNQDMSILKTLQKTLTPTEIPTIPGFEISRKFVYGSKYGGDYFDIFEHDDKMKFGMLVACSSGYAMSALFLSLILKISHVLEAKKGNSPEKILQQIADDLKKISTNAADTTSVFYCVVDRRDYSLEFCSAGKVTGYYLAPQKPLMVLKSLNSALGQQFNEKLSLANLELEAKSKICIVTEGLSEVLGNDLIAKIINENAKNSVHDLRNELLFQAQKKSKLEEPLRDQTVVVVEVKDRMIKLAK